MKFRHFVCGALTALSLQGVALGQVNTGRNVYTCDTTIAAQPALRIQDDASLAGAVLLDPALITLPNGMKAVQFSVQYAKRLLPSQRILKVRYTVEWSDDCGRRLVQAAPTLEGLILNPGQTRSEQSTAPHPTATRAFLRIYVTDN